MKCSKSFMNISLHILISNCYNEKLFWNILVENVSSTKQYLVSVKRKFGGIYNWKFQDRFNLRHVLFRVQSMSSGLRLHLWGIFIHRTVFPLLPNMIPASTRVTNISREKSPIFPFSPEKQPQKSLLLAQLGHRPILESITAARLWTTLLDWPWATYLARSPEGGVGIIKATLTERGKVVIS